MRGCCAFICAAERLHGGGRGAAAAAARRTASSTLPKYFQPVGVSKHSTPRWAATRSSAPEVGMLRATPFSPSLKYGMQLAAFAAMIATESEGETKKPLPTTCGGDRNPRRMWCQIAARWSFSGARVVSLVLTIFRSPSPSDAAPKSGVSSVAALGSATAQSSISSLA